MDRRALLIVCAFVGLTFAGCITETTPEPEGITADTTDERLIDEAPIRSAPANTTGTPVVALSAEPVRNATYAVLLRAPDAGRWVLETPDWRLHVRTDGGAAQVEVPAHPEARPIALNWTFTSGARSVTGNLSYDVWGVPIEFGAEPGEGQDIRPGINSQVCTTNYLFHYKWQRIFLGSAAHCTDGKEVENGPCSTTESAIGETETLEGDVKATYAYSSWTTGNRVDDCNDGNDFALFEIAPADWHRLHPKSHGIVGHVSGLGDCRDLEPAVGFGGSGNDLDLVAYGRSSLRHGLVVRTSPDDARDDKTGRFLESTHDGFQCHVYLATPGIPGDSGGPLATADGLALGAASTVALAPFPGSNHYTNIAAALEFMREHEGWAPELIPSGA